MTVHPNGLPSPYTSTEHYHHGKRELLDYLKRKYEEWNYP